MPAPVIIVTGVSRGIGRAIAEELQARGAAVVGAARNVADVPWAIQGGLDRARAAAPGAVPQDSYGRGMAGFPSRPVHRLGQSLGRDPCRSSPGKAGPLTGG
jgi:NAD(P)-dependent dehydrogenase (short-subunit alcohol dehydrogenase family)